MVFELVISTDYTDHWIGVLSQRIPVSLSLLDMIFDERRAIRSLVEIKIENSTSDAILTVVNQIEGIEIIKVSDVINDVLVMIVGMKRCSVCESIMESGCFFKMARTENGKIIWHLIAPQKEYARRLASSLDRNKVDYELMKLTPLDEKDSISKRQKEILRIAFEGGYFEFPKKMGVRELAKKTKVSTASASETLRRAVKKLVVDYFSDN